MYIGREIPRKTIFILFLLSSAQSIVGVHQILLPEILQENYLEIFV